MIELRPYPKYKDSGVEWIGEIPEEWKIKPLFTLLREIKNKNKNNSETNVLSLSYGKIIQRNVEKNFGLLPKSFATYNIVKKGNIVLRLTDLQNDKRSLRIGYVNERGIITSAYVTLGGDISNEKFQYYYLHSLDLMKIFYGLGDGVRQTMSFKDLKWLSIIVPPQDKLNKISRFLDKQTAQIDSLITDKEQLIELLEEKRQAVITETVTKGLDSNVKMKDSGIEWIGEIPEHWVVTKLGRLSNIIDPEPSHRAPAMAKEGGFPYVGIRDINADGTINVETARLIEETSLLEQEQRFEIENTDIIFCRVATLGYPRIIKKETRVALSATIALIKHQPAKINYLYLLYCLDSLPIKTQSDLFSTGSTRRALGMNVIRKFDVTLPAMDEQIKIVEYIKQVSDNIRTLIEYEKTTITKLKEHRESLIYEAVTGKIDLRDYEVENTKV